MRNLLGLSALVLVFGAVACSSAEETPAPAPGDTGTLDTGAPPVDTGDDTSAPPVDTGTPPVDTGTPPVDTGTPPTDTGTPPTDASSGACKASTISSTCGPQAIVRVSVTLKAGMADAKGNVIVSLNHYRLGSGATGGVYHFKGNTPGATVGATTAADVAFDFCGGGRMWSEDTCEYVLWGWVDVNGNGVLDAGEPAGQTAPLNVSCHASGSPCYALELGCTAGKSCIAFTDPGGSCKCGPACTPPSIYTFCK